MGLRLSERWKTDGKNRRSSILWTRLHERRVLSTSASPMCCRHPAMNMVFGSLKWSAVGVAFPVMAPSAAEASPHLLQKRPKLGGGSAHISSDSRAAATCSSGSNSSRRQVLSLFALCEAELCTGRERGA